VNSNVPRREADRYLSEPNISVITRIAKVIEMLIGLRKQDFQAAGHFVQLQWGHLPWPVRWARFLGWGIYQLFINLPQRTCGLVIRGRISRTPMWLLDENRWAEHPWRDDGAARLPGEVDTVVIGAGFTGGAVAYHWARRASSDQSLVVLEMDDPASGASGRNEGLVVMGRYFKMVRDTVGHHLPRVRPDLESSARKQLASQFAMAYCRAAYRNADLIAETIEEHGFRCDYQRAGWVQARTSDEQKALRLSVKLAEQSGCDDWTMIESFEVKQRSGMRVTQPAGFSRQAASWHPAKWVWCLLDVALASDNVELYTRTRVDRVLEQQRGYLVETARGVIRARNVVYATESYTPNLETGFRDVILPMQEQAASGEGGPVSMEPHIGISGSWYFAGRYGRDVLFGSGGSRVPDHQAGRNLPSRFLTRFAAAEMRDHFGPYELELENEWSGTVGYTPDEFPVVGSIDGAGRWIIGGMCGSGSGVAFNGGRCIVNRILGLDDEPDDYPPEYFAPGRLLDPAGHCWPDVNHGR
jgi:glycine/D-amino acid oxidase-like deaminating enzyme